MSDEKTPVDAYIDALKKKLEADLTYQELQIYEEARRKALALRERHTLKEEGPSPSERPRGGGPRGKISIMAAAHEALKMADHPLTTNELLELIPKLGAEMGGKDKKANLVSQLSGGKTSLARALVSIKWNGNSTWWFADKPLPTETAGSAANDPAVPESLNQGGTQMEPP